MRRREFITLLGGAAALPLAARAQQSERVRRIGVLMPFDENDPEAKRRYGAFTQALAGLGWSDGRNIRIESRFAAGSAERLSTQIAELLSFAPDVVLADSTPVLSALRGASRTVPIVFVQVSDPVAGGFVSNLSRPGGNLTGFTNYEAAIAGKWLGLLKEIAPKLIRVAVIYDPGLPPSALYLSSIEDGARSFGTQLLRLAVHDDSEIEYEINQLAPATDTGLLVLPSPFTATHRDLIVALAAKHRIPAVYPYRFFAIDGGLMAYGSDPLDPYRGAAGYVDRILRGGKPADLPVQAPTKFGLVINLKTAKALGLTVSPVLLAIADEVIE